MFSRQPPNSLPTVGQMAMAALFGVLVGLTIVHFTSRPIFPGIPGAQVASTNRSDRFGQPARNRFGFPGSVSNAFNSLTRMSVVPSLDRQMNILLMGVDSNGRNTQRFLNTRSDTMMLVHLDPATRKVGVVSIPRDSRVKLAGNHGLDKINAAHALGGPELATETVREFFAVPVDRYVVVDAYGLKKLFEALGPVEVLVEKRMRYRDRAAGLYVDLKPGLQQLDPKQAEEYVRFRHDAKGDIGRIERQQWFVRQVSQKLKEPSVLLKLPEIFKFANDYVVTDLTIDEMARLANFGKDIEPHQVETAMLPGRAEMIHGGSYWVPDVESCCVVFSRVLGQPVSVAERQEKEEYFGGDAARAATTIAHANNYAYGERNAPYGERNAPYGERNAPYGERNAPYGERNAPYGERDARQSHGPHDSHGAILIRYPRGQEQQARQLERALNSSGFRVRYMIRADLSDCQHEQIVQNSFRADELLTQRLRDKFPCLTKWPVVLNVEPRSHIDFTLVLSPTSAFDLAQSIGGQSVSDAPVSDAPVSDTPVSGAREKQASGETREERPRI